MKETSFGQKRRSLYKIENLRQETNAWEMESSDKEPCETKKDFRQEHLEGGGEASERSDGGAR